MKLNNFLDDVLLFIYDVIYDTMYLINNLFFPDGWIKFITIPLVILSLTYYIITSYELKKNKSYITQLFQRFMMVLTVYVHITIGSLIMGKIVSEAIDRKEIALQLENPLIKKEIIVNGELEKNPNKLIHSFINIKNKSKKGSYQEKLNIEIVLNKKTLKFQLQENENIQNDYWVFFFKENSNKYKYIGHIKTDYFEK